MLKWWEKTVEYYFVRKFVDEKTLAAPLDGDEERAGDTILSNGHKWILIEFKKDSGSIKTEYTKFNNYLNAKSELSNFDGHHFLIYGLLTQEKEEFGIKAITYFSNKSPVDMNNILSTGVDIESFQLYLTKFFNLKRNSSGGTGGIFLHSSMVAGVVETNGGFKIVKCMSLMEYALTMQKNLIHAQTQVRTKDIEPDRGGLSR